MIILPPEEKKDSPVMKWTFRVLMTLCIFFGLVLFGVKILSGTSDSHRRGLEQAMSNVFATKLKIQNLQAFNILPQFMIDAENIDAAGGDFEATNIKIAFSFLDLLMEKGIIEDVQVKDARFAAGIVGPQDLMISSLKVVPATTERAAYADLSGNYGGTPLAVKIDLTQLPRYRPAYRVTKGAPLSGTLGSFSLTGVVGLNKDDFQEINDVHLYLDGKEIATGSILLKPVNRKLALHITFSIGKTTGLATYIPSQSHQTFAFKTLDLKEAMSADAAWLKILNAWHDDVLRMSSATKGSASGNQILFSAEHIEGAAEGSRIEGRFVYADHHVSGWWKGSLSRIESAHKKMPYQGDVTCAIFDLAPKGNRWISNYVLMQLGGMTAKGKLEIDKKMALVKFSLDKVSEGQSDFGSDFSTLRAHAKELDLEAQSVCPGYGLIPAAAPADTPKP